MALNINTNIAALKAQNRLNQTSKGLQKSLERLSSGLRINWAADDAAGLAIADGLRATAKGLAQAIRNANEGISLIKVADGALIEYGNILATLKEKVTQAANATQNAETRKSIQRDINKLLAELNNIARTTEFNGQKLLSGSFVNKKFQIGSASYVTATLSIRSAETNAVGGTKTAVMDLNTIGPVQLTLTNAASGLTVTTEKIELYYNNNPDNGAGALANEINRYSGITGISAVAVVETESEQIKAGSISGLKINGVTIGDITVQAADADGALANAINQKSLETGVTATVTEDGRLVLTSSDGRAIKVEADSGLGSVLGKTADELSTLGHIRLIQKGVADFQIQGVGGTGLGATFTVKSGTSTEISDRSTLAVNSQVAAGSLLAEGSTVGGDATLMSTMGNSDSSIYVTSSSQIGWGSTLKAGTVVTGEVVVGGATDQKTALTQDMVATAGSVLKAGTVIGKGTVVYGELARALGVAEGSTLAGSATLATDVTLDTDIALKYDPTENTQIQNGSTLAAGSKLGADMMIGLTYSSATSSDGILAPTSAWTGVLQNDETATYTVSASSGTATINDGSLIKAGTSLTFSEGGTGTEYMTITPGSNTVIWGVYNDGTTSTTVSIGSGATDYASLTLTDGQSFTFLYDTYVDGNLVFEVNDSDATTDTSSFQMTYKAGSYINGGSVNNLSETDDGDIDYYATVSKNTATFNADTDVAAGSSLVNGTTTLAAGSRFGEDAHVKQFTSDNEETVLVRGTKLYAGTQAQAGSVLFTESFQVQSDVTLNEDMAVRAGTTLAQDTKLAAGTVVQETMTLYTSTGGGGTAVTVSAGTVLDQDLYVGTGGVTLTQDLVLAKGSEIKADSDLVLAGVGDLGQVETKQLSDLNVLTYESAQISLTIVEAAVADIDGIRAELGSVQNQLESTVANISVTQVNVQAAESAIREVDFAAESANFTKMQVLMQAGMFALAQSNTIPQMAVQLLQG